MSVKRRSGLDEDEGTIPKGAVIFGYLQKQGRNGKWQTRWFESDGKCLSYYKSEKRAKVLATLDLANVGSIRVNREIYGGCGFTINISQRPYHLRADSKQSCKDWVITLNRVKEARMQQGNVKITQPPDLLDDSVTPRVVVVSSRTRTHALDDEDIHNWETTGYAPNSPSKETPSSSLARWQKSRRKLTSLAQKVLRWARSIRKRGNLGCIDAQSHVVLDHHVHPPGHDDFKRKMDTSSQAKTGELLSFPEESSSTTPETGELMTFPETASNATPETPGLMTFPETASNVGPAKKVDSSAPKETDDLAWLRDEGIVLTGSSLTSASGSDSLARPRMDSIDARVLS